MTVIVQNNTAAFLSTAVSASDTGLAVQVGSGALFPTLQSGDYFYATLSATNGEYEIVKATARAGDNFTVVRAQEGTSARSFVAGSRIEIRVTARSVIELVGPGVVGPAGPAGPAGPIGPAGPSGPEIIANITALRALNALGSVPAQVQLTNTHVAGDGGGAFRYDASDTTTADNAGTVIVDAAGRRWKRQYSGAINVRWFGATGLDATADQSTAIFAAVAACEAAGRGTVYFPDGTYRFKNLRSLGRINFEGQTAGNVVWALPLSAVNGDYLYYNTNISTYADFDIEMKNIFIDGEYRFNAAAQVCFTPLLNFSKVTRLKLEKVRAYRSIYIAIAMAGCKDVIVRDCAAIACGFLGATLSPVTLSIASPCVVTSAGHGLTVNSAFRFSTTGALPTGVDAYTSYYVKTATTDTFTFSATGGYLPIGAAVNTTGSQSGVQSITTHSSNGGPSIWVSNSGADQSERVLIDNYNAQDCNWTAIHTNGYDITINGGNIKNCKEAGVFSPNAVGTDILTKSLLINGLTIDGITENDISGSGLEIGGENITVTNCNITNTDHNSMAFLDAQYVVVANNNLSNFCIDSLLSYPQASGVAMLSTATPQICGSAVISGNCIMDTQVVKTGYAAVTLAAIGGATISDVLVTGNTFDDITWVSGSTYILTSVGGDIVFADNLNAANYPYATVPAGGRLTLTTAVPVTTTDVTGATTIYYTPYINNIIPIYNGQGYVNRTFTELSNITTNSATGKAGPATVTTASNYDLFVWNDAGTLRLTRGPLWTSSTARGTGAGTTELVSVLGTYLNAVAISNGPAAQRGTYVGTVRSDGSSQINDSLLLRHVWNQFNRTSRRLSVTDATATWTYSTAAYRQANGSTANQVSIVCGQNEDIVSLKCVSRVGNSTGTERVVLSSIGLDTTTTPGAVPLTGFGVCTAGLTQNLLSSIDTYPGLGFHYFAWLERGAGTDTQTWESGGSNGIRGFCNA